jgi:23S rRNA pseudouridine1911/1915/1917 synthase
MNKFNFIPDDTDENTRLDNYLSNLFTDITRSQIQNLIKDGKGLVNGVPKKSGYKLRAGEKVELEVADQEPDVIKPQDIPLNIVYEDDNMLVVNKPSGMLTHPTQLEREDTLVNALLFKYGENLSDINGYFRRGILHRLDRNTSGLLMVAKNNKTHEFLANQIKEKTAIRQYLTIVKGSFPKETGVINFPIGRHPTQPHKMAVVEGGKTSITEYKVLQRFQENTYMELTLKTGRTHQIRVHLSHLFHPIVNDSLYGGGRLKVKTEEQVLQAYKLSFAKPFCKHMIELEIEPDDQIVKVLNYLKNKKE